MTSCLRMWPHPPICAPRWRASRTWISRSSRKSPPRAPRAKSRPSPRRNPATDTGDSSDPARLYLKEMGNFQLLSREQEVEIAKRIEAGEQEGEEELPTSPAPL